MVYDDSQTLIGSLLFLEFACSIKFHDVCTPYSIVNAYIYYELAFVAVGLTLSLVAILHTAYLSSTTRYLAYTTCHALLHDHKSK